MTILPHARRAEPLPDLRAQRRMEPSIGTRDAPPPAGICFGSSRLRPIHRCHGLVRDTDARSLAEVLIRIGESKFGKITEVERIALLDALEKPRPMDILPKFMAAHGWREAIDVLGRK